MTTKSATAKAPKPRAARAGVKAGNKAGAAPAAPATPDTQEGTAPATAVAPLPPAGGEVGGEGKVVTGVVASMPGEPAAGIQADSHGLDPVAGQEPVVTAYLVKAKRDGFRRAGRAWSKAETRVEAADLTDDQVDAILSEPRLDVVVVAE